MLYLLVSTGFQVLFHSPPGVLFTFPSQYYSLSVIRQCLGLEGGPPGFPRDSSCPAVLWILSADSVFRLQDSHLLRFAFPCNSPIPCQCLLQSATPTTLLQSVWPPPLSLATTRGISVDFFSSPYLDVSVQAVPLIYLFYSVYDTRSLLRVDCSIRTSAGISSACDSPQLFAACHVLLRLLMPRHSPCALFSLTFLNYAPFARQNCSCYQLTFLIKNI